MLVESVLSNKMMINFDDEKLGAFSQRHVRFYVKYSSFVFKVLQKPTFQKFLIWMLKKEKIEEKSVKQVHIKLLPLRKSGQGIAGKCDPSRGRIQIYPKTVKFCHMFRQKFGRKNLFVYAGSRARAALIHEILHLKYTMDETTVRELSQEYFCIFTNKQSERNLQVRCTNIMVFNAKSYEEFPPDAPVNSWDRLKPD